MIYSSASILDTSLVGTGGSPEPMATYSSGAKRGGVVTELDRPWVHTLRTEPTGGRLPSAMGKNSNPEEIHIYMAPMVMGIGMQGYVWVLVLHR